MTSVEWRRAVSASGLLREFSDAEVVDAADVHVAQRLAAMVSESDETVRLAVDSVMTRRREMRLLSRQTISHAMVCPPASKMIR